MDIRDDVVQRLAGFGYEVQPDDDWMLDFCTGKVESTIKSTCNQAEIPEGLRHCFVDQVCGEFLSGKRSSGQLSGFDFQAAVKSVKAGDTDVTFAVEGSKTAEQRFDELLSGLCSAGQEDMEHYRRMRW